jgi:hypothetical protein
MFKSGQLSVVDADKLGCPSTFTPKINKTWNVADLCLSLLHSFRPQEPHYSAMPILGIHF